MKTVVSVSAVLIAALNSPGTALERVGPDEPARSSPSGVRLAQVGSVELPATRVSGVSGTPIALSLQSPVGGVRFVKISDFPEQLQLSRGFRLRGSWVISGQDLDALELTAPPGLVQTIRLEVMYFRNNQTPAVAQRALTVELESAEAVASNAPQKDIQPVPIAQPPAVQRPAAPSGKVVSLEQETDSLERGAALMRNGDIAAARLLYEDLAVKGSAKGARALAETYDPTYLKGIFIAGLRPSMEKARIWYERAAELGDSVSITRLSGLDRR